MAWRHFVAMGDSITEGWGEGYRGIEPLSWADRLAQAIAPLHPEFQYTNLAYRGLTSDQVEAFQLERALALRPDLVSLNAGANDIGWPGFDAEAYRARMDGMFAALRRGGAALMTFTLADVWRIHKRAPAGFQGHAKVMNDIIRELARQYEAVFFDFWVHPEVMPPDSWGSDGVHPNSLGYVRMAVALAGELGRRAGIEISGPGLDTVA